MKYFPFYKKILNCKNETEVFDYFMNSLQSSIADWTFFVDWEKVKKNIANIETELNILNSLIGKAKIDDEFIELVKKYPETRKALPLLVAIRRSKLKEMLILKNKDTLLVESREHLFQPKSILSKENERDLKLFFKESGLSSIFSDRTLKNLVDYCYGVEVGMDTNARKNRGGHNMENIVEVFIKDLCEKKRYKYLKEANALKIKNEWGYNVPVDKSSRRYDFVINNGKELTIFETNFYGGGGSKLKSTAGEYRNLFDVLKGKYKFIWITDGFGWKSAKLPLKETFNHNNYIFNLAMLKNSILEELSDL